MSFLYPGYQSLRLPIHSLRVLISRVLHFDVVIFVFFFFS